jgi:predicted AlkP superfamily phosphohydrolase/phosphomutase
MLTFHLTIFFLGLWGLFHLLLALVIGGYYYVTLNMADYQSIGLTTRFFLDFGLSYLLISCLAGLPLAVAAALLLRSSWRDRKWPIFFSRVILLFTSFSLLFGAVLLANTEKIGSEVTLIPLFAGGCLMALLLALVFLKFPSEKKSGPRLRWKIPAVCAICCSLSVLILASQFTGVSRGDAPDPGTVPRQQTGVRVLMLGIDGADWLVMDRFMAEGILPNLLKVKEEAALGDLDVKIWYTAPSWTTIFSGVDHRVHGVVDYLGYADQAGRLIRKTGFDDFMVRILKGAPLEKVPQGRLHQICVFPLKIWRALYSDWVYPFEKVRKPIFATHIEQKRIWQITSDMGMKTGVFSADLSWPAGNINGFLISDRFMLGERLLAAYPNSLYNEVSHFLEGPVTFPEAFPFFEPDNLTDALFLRGVREQYERQAREIAVSRHLWEKAENRYDFLIFKFRQPDSIKHRFLQFIRPDVFPWFSYDPAKGEQLLSGIRASYRLFDDFLGEVMDSGYTMVILSDHGFYPVARDLVYQLGVDMPFKLDRFLEDRGWLRRKPDGTIDWSKTRAYSPDFIKPKGIRINLQGREPSGIVSGAQYAELVEEIGQTLSSAVFEPSGSPVFSHVRREIREYDVAYFFDETAPLEEILRFAERRVRIGDAVYPFDELFEFSPIYGGHKLYPRFKEKAGQTFFLMHGGPIKPGVRLSAPEDIDITPTLLYLLGLPQSEAFQGRVLTEAINPRFLARHPVQSIPTYGAHHFSDGILETVRTREDRSAEKKLMDNLQALGYLKPE